jgi:hypothetical protein
MPAERGERWSTGAVPARRVGCRPWAARRGARARAGGLPGQAAACSGRARAGAGGGPAGRVVTADGVYGGDAQLRAFLEQRDVAYVLAVKATQPLWAAGTQGPAELPARELVARLPARAWQRLSPGDGAKGPRVYASARVALTRPGWPGCRFLAAGASAAVGGGAGLLRLLGPARTTLAELVGWPGSAGRWRNASRPPRTRSAWTTTRSAAGTPVSACDPGAGRPGVPGGGGPRPGRRGG